MISRKVRRLSAIGAALAGLIATPVMATESGTYFGLSVGQSSFDVSSNDVKEFFIVPSAIQVDDSDTAYAISLGYRFNPYFGIELSYNNLGEAVASETGRTTGLSYGVDLTGELNGVGFAVTGAVPLGGFEFNARAGLFRARTDTHWTIRASGSLNFNDTQSETETTNDFMYGVGAGYTFGEHFQLRVDYLKVTAEYTVDDSEPSLDVDSDLLTAGFQYRF